MENTRTKFKYYDASPNPDHFTKEQIDRVIAALNGRYVVKCDDCKVTIGRTDSMIESAEGGQCVPCANQK